MVKLSAKNIFKASWELSQRTLQKQTQINNASNKQQYIIAVAVPIFYKCHQQATSKL